MNASVLLILVFLTNGTPLPTFFVVPAGIECNGNLAAEYARKYITPGLVGVSIQDPTKFGSFECLPIPDPIAPGPADPGALPVPEEPEEPGEPLSKPQREAGISRSSRLF